MATTGAAESYPWHRAVPHADSEAELQALRDLLAEYTEAGVCARLNIPDLGAHVPPGASQQAKPILSRLDALIRLFLDCLYVPENALAPHEIALLDHMRLIGRTPERAGFVFAMAAIVPAEGELTICDRGNAPDGSRCPLPPDVVHPPTFEHTHRFLAGLPLTPCEAMLDLGTGTGIAALRGARCARRVWATDITERAVAFAELNRCLAGVENVTVVQGDLYQPVEGLTFDRIVIHPPYVPARRSQFVFRDAGEDGSAIIRGAVEGLPRFLRSGGRFYSTLLASDRVGETFEQRVRRWLGEAHREFDIAIAAHSVQSPSEFLAQYLMEGPIDADDVQFWTEMWHATGTEAVLYVSLIVERHASAREPATVRVHPGKGYTARRLEGLLDWEAALQMPAAGERLLAGNPRYHRTALLRRLAGCRTASSKSRQ